MSIQEKYKEYKWKEWFVFAIGAILMGWQTYKYIADTLDGDFLDGAVFAISLLLIFAPKTLVKIAEGRAGGK